MPAGFEDPTTENQRDLLHGQIESTLNETLDRICKPSS
jgi:D-alanyl-D-alanine carboxypeptidase